MSTEIIQHDQRLETTLKLLNDRFPILVDPDQPELRDRVGTARIEDDGEAGTYSLHVTTFRGRTMVYRHIKDATLTITEQDVHGVPIRYQLELDGPEGRKTLAFFA